LRNRLKERIKDLTGAINNAEFSKNNGTEENTSPCDGKTLEEGIVEVHALMDLLRELNDRIEKVNVVNRASLIMLETLKVKIAFYEKLVQKCRDYKTYELEYNAESKMIKVDKELLVDQGKITTILVSLKKEKDTLEGEITASNFNTAIDFDSERILSRI
jgi:hypothetical protein